MRNYQTKSNQGALPDSITATRFGAGEFNSVAVELEGAVTTSGQTLAPADGAGEVTDQLAMALAIYGAGGATYHIDTGAVNAYVLTPVSPKESPNALFNGFSVVFEPGTVNTTASTVNVGGLGVKSITLQNGTALSGGEISGTCCLKYNLADDRFELIYSSDSALKISQYYEIDASQADQGATSTNSETMTIYDVATLVGTSKFATIHLSHNPVAGNQTLYTFDTSLDLTSYPFLFFEIDSGAQIDRTTGDELLTFYSPKNVIAESQFITVDMVRFANGGVVLKAWWGDTLFATMLTNGSIDDLVSVWEGSSTGYFDHYTNAGASTVSLNPRPEDNTSIANLSMFRETDTSGESRLTIYRGNGTATNPSHRLSTTDNSWVNALGSSKDSQPFSIGAEGSINQYQLLVSRIDFESSDLNAENNHLIEVAADGDHGTFEGPIVDLIRGGNPSNTLTPTVNTPSDGDKIGCLRCTGRTVDYSAVVYAGVHGEIISANNSTPQGKLILKTIYNGTTYATNYLSRLEIARGVYTPNADGGDKGEDTINALYLYSRYGFITQTADSIALTVDHQNTSTVQPAVKVFYDNNAGTGVAIDIDRTNSDGNLINFRSGGTTEGTISVSGTTVTYGTFCGSHDSKFEYAQDNVFEGTVLESVSELMEREDDQPARLPKIKISDKHKSNAVYGVFLKKQGDGKVLVASLGAFKVRINKDTWLMIGDLLQSNGDGTATTQDDDIFRSSTIAKVISDKRIETFSDGSYTVPCTLHCG